MGAPLHDYCARRDIALIDPTPFLLARQRAGEPPYDDHFSLAGHRAFADAFVTFFAASEAIAPAGRAAGQIACRDGGCAN